MRGSWRESEERGILRGSKHALEGEREGERDRQAIWQYESQYSHRNGAVATVRTVLISSKSLRKDPGGR